jgi:hypothetical protein
MVVVTGYRLRQENDGTISVQSEEKLPCPVCGDLLRVIGSRKRNFTDGSGLKRRLRIRRKKCRACKCVHHELPDIVTPYKRHCTETIENIIEGNTEVVSCEESTIRKIWSWWLSLRLYFESIIASLRAKYGMMFSEHPTPREMFRAVANAHLWIHTRSAFMSG